MPSVKCRGTKDFKTVMLRELEVEGILQGLKEGQHFWTKSEF